MTTDPYVDATFAILAPPIYPSETPHFVERRAGGSGLTGHLSAFERVGRAAVLIDEGGRLIEANACVRFGDGLQLAQGRLHAPRAADRKRLREFLAAMVRPDRSSDEYAPTLALPRPSGLRPWLLAHIDCRKISRGRARPAAILLLITDVEAPARLPRGLLMQVFGLTVTEAQLARELATGMALQEASLQLGISEGHARQRLKKIFDKTGTSRQGELIALLTRLS